MRVGIEGIKFNNYGGGQLVSAEYIKILQEMGHEVVVFCDQRFSTRETREITKRWGIAPVTFRYVPDQGNVSVNSILFNQLQKKEHLDTYFSVGWLLLSKRESRRVPTYRYSLAPHSPFLFRKFRLMVKRHNTAYYALRCLETGLDSYLDTSGRYAIARYTLSKFIQEKYNRFYGIQYDVLYPPVHLDGLLAGNKIENSIMSLGRIDWEKNYHVIPALARRYPGIQFKIVGGYTPSKQNETLMRELISASRKLDNLALHVNLPRSRVIQLLAESSFLLHLMRKEHFGIAIVEAMRCGTTPIVPIDSGPDEIIEYGAHGSRFPSFRYLLDNLPDLLLERNQATLESRARTFDSSCFTKKAKLTITDFFTRCSLA